METIGKPIEEGTISAPVVFTEPDFLLGISRNGWLALVGGFIAGLAVSLVPGLTYIFSYLAILVHETGHALAGWFFGYPSIPSFDFFYGGGVTIQSDRFIILTAVVLSLFAFLGYWVRYNSFAVFAVAGFAAVYALLAFSRWHEMLIIALGHGTEFIIAGIFIYRAMSGSHIVQRLERPLYAFLGFFILIYNIEFMYSLINDAAFRLEYEFSRGEMEMDLSRIAHEYLNTDVASVAKIFLALALLTPLISLGTNLIHRYRADRKIL